MRSTSSAALKGTAVKFFEYIIKCVKGRGVIVINTLTKK
jgi:hypothetical protein